MEFARVHFHYHLDVFISNRKPLYQRHATPFNSPNKGSSVSKACESIMVRRTQSVETNSLF